VEAYKLIPLVQVIMFGMGTAMSQGFDPRLRTSLLAHFFHPHASPED
jgi:hypothetical protein